MLVVVLVFDWHFNHGCLESPAPQCLQAWLLMVRALLVIPPTEWLQLLLLRTGETHAELHAFHTHGCVCKTQLGVTVRFLLG